VSTDPWPPTGAEGWAGVVYGRTYSADLWWRALPETVDRSGPEAAAVMAAVGGGRGLNRSPRLVLTRGRAGMLLGVACTASRLSDMNSDGRRPLFCFVGWFTADRTAAVPGLDEVEAGWPQWARDEYERRMRWAWKEHPSKLRTPEPTLPEAPPWPDPRQGGPAVPHISREQARAILSSAEGHVRVHPAGERAAVWQAAARYGRHVALVTGWASYHDAVLDGVTDVCADDVSGNQPLLVPVPEARPRGPHEVPTAPKAAVPAAGAAPASVPPEAAPASVPPEVALTSVPPEVAPASFKPDAATGSQPPEASTVGGPPDPAPAGEDSGWWSWDPRKLASRVVHEVAARAGLDNDGRPQPPPEDTLSGWSYSPEHRVYFSEVGGFLSRWDGRKLTRWDGSRWVDWISEGSEPDDDEDQDQDELDGSEMAGAVEAPAQSPPPSLSAEEIDRFNREFGGGA
jgi:hypothetical protein